MIQVKMKLWKLLKNIFAGGLRVITNGPAMPAKRGGYTTQRGKKDRKVMGSLVSTTLDQNRGASYAM